MKIVNRQPTLWMQMLDQYASRGTHLQGRTVLHDSLYEARLGTIFVKVNALKILRKILKIIYSNAFWARPSRFLHSVPSNAFKILLYWHLISMAYEGSKRSRFGEGCYSKHIVAIKILFWPSRNSGGIPFFLG